MQTKTTNEFLVGWDNEFINLMKMGEFLAGTDYDLVTKVYPVMNNPYDPIIRDSQIRMDAGFDTIDKIGRTRVVNMLPTINKNQFVNDGSGVNSKILQINPWNKLIHFDNATNGLQFIPNDENEYVMYYDNRLLRTFNMTDSGEI